MREQDDKTILYMCLTWAVILAVFLVVIHSRAESREWFGILWVLEEPPHYRWTVASGLPDGYEVFACNEDGSVCHYYGDVSEPEIWLSFLKWYAAARRLGLCTTTYCARPRLSVRAFKMTEGGLITGPYSELTEGIGVR